MGFRFRRSFKIAPGVRLNLSSKSTSVRIGPKGLGYTISSNGKRRITASIPGTGLSYSEVTSPAARVLPVAGNKKGGNIWPGLLVVIALIVGIGLFNGGSNGSRSTSTSPPAMTSPGLRAPTQVPPTVSEQSASPAPTVEPVTPSALTEVRYVTASSLNVRSAPNTSGDVLGKLQNGEQVSVLQRENGWLLIQSAPGMHGWVSEQYTSATLDMPAASPPAKALFSAPTPDIDRDAIVQQIIDRSIRNYSGSCPCPYNTMRNGRRCGGNSAYSKPGGRSPICFPSDVPEEMIAAFRP